jgi:hypothetical protein
MLSFQHFRSVFAVAVATYFCGLEVANGNRMKVDEELLGGMTNAVSANAKKAKKPFFNKLLGITTKWTEAEHDDVMKNFGPDGKKLALLLPGENIDMAYNKGKKDFLLFTPKRLIHVDGEKAKGLKRLAGDKGKSTYTTYPWRHIAQYKTTTLGAGELFSLNQETELHVKPSMSGWLQFDFHKDVNILKVNKYFSKSLFSRDRLTWSVLPYLNGVSRLVYSSEVTGRLSQVSFDELPKEVEESLVPKETKLAAFSYKKMLSLGNKDYVLLTDQRIISVDKIGAKKVELDNKPFSSSLRDAITAISVTTASGFDLDSEMFVDVIGVGRSEADFSKSTDTLSLYKQLNAWVLS